MYHYTMFRCQYCSQLSFHHLVDLATQELGPGFIPRRRYYQHRESFSNLETAAQQGCDLCLLILGCFKGAPCDTPYPLIWPDAWLGSACNSDDSMYSVAKELVDSNIRLALNGDAAKDDFSVLSVLLVQVGPSQRQDWDSEDNDLSHPDYWNPDSFWEVPALKLRISCNKGSPCHIGRFRLGLNGTDPDLGSKTNFSLISHWLECCRNQHPQCGATEGLPPLLPTRVIDVGSGNIVETLRIFCTAGTKAEYLAFSHCWGGDVCTKLTAQTMVTFEHGLPYTALPANFQDAITITRNLGFQYLWIDSLCIIQDSKLDWMKESNKMCDVYQNATITISAMASPASTHGILIHSVKQDVDPSPAIFSCSMSGSRLCELRISRWDQNEEGLIQLYQNGALAKRGWTLQESVLSRRIIYYGFHKIFWRCGKELPWWDFVTFKYPIQAEPKV